MSVASPSALDELQHLLRATGYTGALAIDPATRYLYSTDASIYQMQPLAVAWPRTVEDLHRLVEATAALNLPLLARGGGTSLAGQAVGQAVVVDLSRHFRTVHHIDPAARTVTVDVGLPLADLNAALEPHGLRFGPDPASAAQATIGGIVANNSTGAHSIVYGMTGDHLLAADTFLADGSPARWEPLPLPPDGGPPQVPNPRLQAIVDFAWAVRTQHRALVQRRWPRVWRRASGYNLPPLLPWAPGRPPAWPAGQPYPPVPPDHLPLQALLAGSEGTLAVMHRVTLGLVPRPRHTALALLAYPDIVRATADVPRLLEHAPAAVELLPGELFRRALDVPLYARLVRAALGPLLAEGIPEAVLLVEFAADHPAEAQRRAQAVGGYLATHPEHQAHIWQVRKVGLGLLMSRPGDLKPVPFIEDMTVPVERLSEFVAQLDAIFAEHGTEAVYYAHASAGCLHIRPWLNLKTEAGRRALRGIAQDAMALVRALHGVPSGEHGDGLARSEWLQAAFGPELYALFGELKAAADPQGRLNPHKIVDPLPMDAHLRYGPDYATPLAWAGPLFPTPQALAGAVEQCNGAGVCRKSTGAMCPSYQVTHDERHSTRGRANLLRALISGQLPQAEDEAFAALDLCLACQACRAECPSGVDMAKLKWAFLHRYYQRHRRPWRDYLFAYAGKLAPWGRWAAPLVNALLAWKPVHTALARMLHLAPQRSWPRLARRGLRAVSDPEPTVLFLRDGFHEAFDPEVEAAALRLLRAWGQRVAVIPRVENGRALVSKGFLDAARDEARALLAAVQAVDPAGRLPIVGVEPAAVYHLRDTVPELVPTPQARAVAERTWMLEEWAVRQWQNPPGPPRSPSPQTVYVHGHCYQKARPPAADGLPVGAEATRAMLEMLGHTVHLLSTGCCGMAGPFGYEAEHYALSLKVGELSLFPAVRALPPEAVLLAPGFSCRHQVHDALARGALHPAVWLARQWQT